MGMDELDGRIEFYCQLYEKVYKKVLEKNSGDVLAVVLKVFEEVARDLRDGRMERPKKAKISRGNERVLATKRQREALHRFGIRKIPEDLKKREASEALEKLIRLSKGKENMAVGKLIEELNSKWGG
jgi:hypothetical protein